MMQRINDTFLYYQDTAFYYWVITAFEYWWLFGLIGGWCFVSSVLIRSLRIRSIFLGVAILSLLFQVMLYFVLPDLSQNLRGEVYTLPIKHLYAYVFGFIVAGVAAFFFYRKTSNWFEVIKDKFHKSTTLERDGNTDIRKLDTILPKKKPPYSVEKYFKNDHIFIGLNEKNKTVRITREKWLASHVDLVGTTGSGKGVAAGVLLTQASLYGESVIVIDPKEDEFLPHVLGQAAQQAQVPFCYIDLTGEVPQWNPLLNKSPAQIEELFGAAFGLSEKGTDADFYRLNDRKSARLFSSLESDKDTSFPKQVAEFFSQKSEILENSPKFKDDLEEIASLPVVNISNGLDLDNAIKQGAVIYVRGSMRNTRILKLQKMFVLAVMQSCEKRQRESARHVCLFLDEFKYLISKPALEALGAIRDKRAHVVLAHQSLGDLKDCPSDINPDSVVASINENCSLKLTYKVNDPDTADWLARMSGKIQIDQEVRRFDTTKALTEVKTTDRMVRQAERCYIDTNMLQSLPARCAVLYGNDLAELVFTSPIKVSKQDKWLQPTEFSTETKTDSSEQSNLSKSIGEALVDVD
jgi:type IV secretory pathway TraG/TraD family ATPase VirD4